MNWQLANRVASVAAVQAHDELCIDSTQIPIPVADAIDTAGVTLMWQSLPRIFGAYLNDTGSAPGILINNQLNRAGRRQTAAHELGHHMLRHESAVDDGVLGAGMGTALTRPGWSAAERAAEAFGHWFLMPRRAVLALIDDLGGRCATPDVAYQASLHLGVGYVTLVRHLVSLRVISRATAATWTKVSPADIKRRVDTNALLASTREVDVWQVNAGLERTIHVSPGDLIVLSSVGDRLTTDGPLEVDEFAHGRAIVRCTEPPTAETAPAVCSTRSSDVAISVHPRPRGLFIPSTTDRGEAIT